MRAITNIVYARASGQKRRPHLRMQRRHGVFAEVTPRNARLVGDDEKQEPSFVAKANCLRGIFHPDDICEPAEVAGVDVKDPVTI
jgi:hypothetical protein